MASTSLHRLAKRLGLYGAAGIVGCFSALYAADDDAGQHRFRLAASFYAVDDEIYAVDVWLFCTDCAFWLNPLLVYQ